MKEIFLILSLLCYHMTLLCQEIIKINSNNGLTRITYIVSNSFEEGKIDLILSSASLGVEEYRFDKSTVYIEYEEVPPFLTIKCKSGTCIERINHHESIKKHAFPILLTNNEIRNEEIISNLNELFAGSLTRGADMKGKERTIVKSISLRRMDSGTYGIEVKINGVLKEEFILDSGASLISINANIFRKLQEYGTIREFDFLGIIHSRIADGSTVENMLYNLKKINIGDYQFENVKCIVSPNSNAPLLLGQNILKAFGTISIDYEKNRLHIID